MEALLFGLQTSQYAKVDENQLPVFGNNHIAFMHVRVENTVIKGAGQERLHDFPRDFDWINIRIGQDVFIRNSNAVHPFTMTSLPPKSQ